MARKWIVTTIHEPFPVNFGHVSFPSEASRTTALGPFYSAPVRSYMAPEHRDHAEWAARGLRARGWTVTLTEELL